MTKRAGCTARQYSDQMQCGQCGLCWDVNDPGPPACVSVNTVLNSTGKSNKKSKAYEQFKRRHLQTKYS